MPLRLVLFAAALLFATRAPAQEGTLSTLNGKVADGYYTAPGNMYRVPVPVLPELGGQIHDTENVATFDDDLTTHVSIACFPLDPGQQWELEMQGRKGYLTYFYSTYVLPDFQKRFPGSDTEITFFLPGLLDGAVLAVTLLPGGSYFQNKLPSVAGGDPTPAVAKRGTLLFVQQKFIYIVSAELSERVSQGKAFGKTPDEENEILRGRITAFARRIEFPAPPPAKKD